MVLFTRASRNASFSMPTSGRRLWNVCSAPLELSDLSHPGFPPPPMQGRSLSRANRSFFGSLMPVPTENRTYEALPTQRRFGPRPRGRAAFSAGSGLQDTPNRRRPQGWKKVRSSQFTDPEVEIRGYSERSVLRNCRRYTGVVTASATLGATWQ